MLFAFDLDGTVDTFPEPFGTIMRALRNDGHQVVILSATGDEPAPTPEVIEGAMRRLEELGCGDCYDQFVLVGSGPAGVVDDLIVSAGKVAWMRDAGAAALFDDKKANTRAVAEAGMLGLRVQS